MFDFVIVKVKTTGETNGIMTTLTETKEVQIVDSDISKGKRHNVRVRDNAGFVCYIDDMTDLTFVREYDSPDPNCVPAQWWTVEAHLLRDLPEPEPQADWAWADSIFEASDWYDMCVNHVDDSEFMPETGNHVYQMDNGGCVVVTPRADVLIQG
jgi:hypothetical protein